MQSDMTATTKPDSCTHVLVLSALCFILCTTFLLEININNLV
jgi:hypothetical protein